jgi:anti-sigma B factor antagonist
MQYLYDLKDDILLITLSGNLIGEDNGPEIIEKVNDFINENVILCAVDISNVKYINSSGIGVLITLLTKFRNKGGELYLINPSEHVKKLIIITKLNAIFNIVNEVEEAVNSLQKIKQ